MVPDAAGFVIAASWHADAPASCQETWALAAQTRPPERASMVSASNHRAIREKLAEMDTLAPTPPAPGDWFPLELVHLLDTARHVIDEHVNDNGTCAECRSIWPCQRARLAESALAVL
jgi:hypothetical protein